jgi:uncharacterized coiled-coil DUF342 family protein
MEQSQFLNDFQNQMDRLTNIRQQIQSSVEFKKQFTDDLESTLKEINKKIVKLSQMINDLKTKASKLEDQVKTNTSSIGDKESELQKYKDQITSLTSENAKLKEDAFQQQKANETEMARLQVLIDEKEGKLRVVTQEKEKLDNQMKISKLELGAFVTGANSKGDSEQARAEAIKSATAQFQTMLENKQNELIKQIANYDAKIVDLKNKNETMTKELAEKQKEIDELTVQAQTSAQDLQQKIDTLKAENDNLTDRITVATKAIDQANNELQNVVDTVPNVKTKNDVDILFNGIREQLDKSIQNISVADQGQTSSIIGTLIPGAINVFNENRDNEKPPFPAEEKKAPEVQQSTNEVQQSTNEVQPEQVSNTGTTGNTDVNFNVNPSQALVPGDQGNAGNDTTDLINDDEDVKFKDMKTGNHTTDLINDDEDVKFKDMKTGKEHSFKYLQLKKKLIRKILDQNKTRPGTDNKYMDALQNLRKVADPSQVQKVLQLKGVELNFNNGELKGGRITRKAMRSRKTKKIRKQKGGFIYKQNTKRKRIRSSQIRNLSRRLFR